MIETLKKYVLKNKLHEKAIEYFWVAFNNWKKEHSVEYSKKFKNISENDLNVFVHTIGLRSSEWPDGGYDHVTVSVLIFYKDKQLGKYIAWFPLSDDVHGDDFLEI